MQNIQAVVFDAYGTLFDVHSVLAAAEAAWPGHGAALSGLWRAKQLEYTWLRSLMGRYVDFRSVTADALAYACRSLGLPLTDATRADLLGAYLRLSPFPEVPAALQALKPGRRLVIFSNGSPDMLLPLVSHSGLDRFIDLTISADAAGVYKPDPRSYALVTAALGLPAERMLFVSSNPFDAAGSRAFGFHVAWVNRTGVPFDELGITPNLTVSRLTEIASGL